ncbi:hypothetical protein [Paraflavitalea speifideaquila]|uniref:hypothetical protein n=1 Tax=Paraflavitalea speifideaquila TaxID=3076558 RepID=UPI0028E19575|nr:hypothetical protein [Paraflavitalea speifideiaquila]
MDATYTLKQNNLTPAVSVLYNFLRKPTYKVYFGAGIQYNFSTYPTNEYVTRGNENNPQKNLLDFEKGWVDGTIRVGGIINNTFDIGLLAKVGGSFERFFI